MFRETGSGLSKILRWVLKYDILQISQNLQSRTAPDKPVAAIYGVRLRSYWHKSIVLA